MLTGLYPSHHGVKSHETRLAESLVTLAEEFRDHGFATLGVVNTWNVGAPQFQLSQGFERFFYVPEAKENAAAKMRVENGGTQVLAKAREFVEGAGAKPFFLFLHFYDVHTDFTPEPSYRAQFVEPYTGRLNGRTQQLIGMRNRGKVLSADDLRFLRQMYDAEIRELDDQLTTFFAWLDARSALADTLLVVTSDHGEEFQEHGGILHGRTQYQELLHVPLLLAGPGVPAARVLDTPVSGVDVTPTILALAGVPSSMARDGCDLSALWRGGTLPERALFGEADHTNLVDGKPVNDVKAMVRRGNEKLHLDRPSGTTTLFDLAQDPAELHDLAATRPELARTLRAELERFDAGARRAEAISGPSETDKKLLDELGYGGETDE
jgi:arylsulfatase A-like enzyme